MDARIQGLLEKAWEIENKSIIAYMGWIKILSEIGIKNKEIRDFIAKIVEDSVIHKRLVEAITEALNDREDIKDEIFRSSSREGLMECDDEVLMLLKRMIKEHDEIEKDAAELYKELSHSVDDELLKSVFILIARDEERHDEYMEEFERIVDRVCRT